MDANPYIGEWGQHFGHCNACGEEAELGAECADPGCDSGEVVPYDDDPDPDA